MPGRQTLHIEGGDDEFRITIPPESRLKYEPDQATLLVIDPKGNHLAGWRGVHGFRLDGIEKIDTE